MSGLTRVPYSLLEGVTPIKWVGDETERTELLGSANEDLDNGFFFLQKNGDGTAQIFAMTFSATHVPSWVEISGGNGGTDLSGITSLDQLPEVLQEELAKKLDADFSDLPKSEVAELSGTDIVVGKDSSGNPVTITMTQIKEYIDASSPNKYWCGYHGNLTELQNWVAQENINVSQGAWAILRDTDTVWVYDTDKGEWKDTGVNSALPASTEIKGENGIIVEGTLADGEVTIKADTDVLVKSDDPRLDSILIGKGAALPETSDIAKPGNIGKFYLQTTTIDGKEYGELYQLLKAAPGPEWLKVGLPQAAKKEPLVISNITMTGSSFDISGAYSDDDYIFLVFISGILQFKDMFGVYPDKNANKTNITFEGSVKEPLPVNVVLLPR